MKNSLIILVILLPVYFFACKNKNNRLAIKVSLVKAFIEDTISFVDLSFKIRVHNYSEKSVIFNFKKSPSLYTGTRQSDFNCWIKWKNSLGEMENEILLSPFFSAPAEIKAGGVYDFLFLNHSSHYTFIQQYTGNRSKFDSFFKRLVDKKMYVFVSDSMNKSDLLDTIPVAVDTSFNISFDKAYVQDFEK